MGIEINLWFQDLLESTADDLAQERVEAGIEKGEFKKGTYRHRDNGYGSRFEPQMGSTTFTYELNNGHRNLYVSIGDVLRRLMEPEK
jgi:hypothetical protein